MSCAVCPHIDERSRNPILVHTTQYIYIRVRLYNIKYILHQLYCILYDILYSVNTICQKECSTGCSSLPI